MSYAGFWKRVAASILDYLVIYAPCLILFLMGVDGTTVAGLYVIIYLPYFAFFESSAKQATPGKMALGIIVTDLNGNRISFWKSTVRLFGKLLSNIILGIGYLMVAFTKRKQGLHDIIADTLVVNK